MAARRFSFALVAIVLICSLSHGAPPDGEEPVRDLERLRGVWEVVANHAAGEQRGPDWLQAAQMSIRFEGDRFTFRSFGRSEEYEISIDGARSVFTARLVVVDGKQIRDQEPDTWLYEVRGDTLRVGFGLGDGKPPDRLDPSSKKQVVYTCRQTKK